ncbi:MAG: translesion DNA synthesis-associated protein ImuA [Betaproteobacteria bacterium]|nr:MAG: translesion DNA synthesis-associated protein ImuA [Betaproteobacteria bacterium]
MSAALESILQQHPVWRGGAVSCAAPAVPSGFASLDRELPGGGWPAGALTELLGEREGIGELQLLLPALAALSWAGKRIVWLAPPHLPYAPALAAAGIDLAHLAVVRAPGRRDALWAAEQVLRSASCHALLAWFPSARYEELRRLSVAAVEAGQTWVTLFRPLKAAHESSPAALRIVLEPEGDGLSLHILKRRGAPAAAPLRLPVKRPVHALGRTSFPAPAAGRARDDRRLGVPVHA